MNCQPKSGCRPASFKALFRSYPSKRMSVSASSSMSVPHRYNTRFQKKNRATVSTSIIPPPITTSNTLRKECIWGECLVITQSQETPKMSQETPKKPLGPPPGFEHVTPKAPRPVTTPTTTPITTKKINHYDKPRMGYDINQTIAYQVKQSTIYITTQLNGCEKVVGTKNKKMYCTNIFNHLLANHGLLILYPDFRATVLKKVNEIITECKKNVEDFKQKELEEELDNLQDKITKRLYNRDYSLRIKSHINDIKNIIDMANTDLQNEPIVDLCNDVRNLINNVITTHPNYVA